MRFWITKNSEVSVREQLVRQIILGILSEDLPAGDKLPGIRAIARRHKIHSNTVSAAYHNLLEQGWLELRRGSGLYVRAQKAQAADRDPLDQLLARLLRESHELGHDPDVVLLRLEQLIHPRKYGRIFIAEPETALREILEREIDIPSARGAEPGPDCLIATLQTRLASVRGQYPPESPLFVLRMRSVPLSLEGQPRPAPNTILTIVSASKEFRGWSRAVLIAVGIEPEQLCEVDTSLAGWQERAQAGALAITDVVAANQLPAGCQFRVFRIVSDFSIAELKRMCDCDALK